MADQRITDLAALIARAGDEIPINRSGVDGKILAEDIPFASDDLNLTLAVMQMQIADLLNIGNFLGDSGNRFSDSFETTTYLDTGTSVNMDTGTPGLIKPTPLMSAEASQFISRISDPGADRQALYAALIDSLVSSGVWAKLDALYMFASADEATALTNLRQSSYGGTASGAPSFASDQGYTGASGKYIDSGFNPTTASGHFVQNSASLFVWSLTAAAVGGGGGGAAGYASGGNSYIYPRYADNNAYAQIAGGSTMTPTVATGAGLTLVNRSGASATQEYRDGSSIASGGSSSAAPTNANLVALAGDGGYYDAGQLAAFGFGSTLDGTDNANLYSALHTYLQAVAGVA